MNKEISVLQMKLCELSDIEYTVFVAIWFALGWYNNKAVLNHISTIVVILGESFMIHVNATGLNYLGFTCINLEKQITSLQSELSI